MNQRTTARPPARQVSVDLVPYTAELSFSSLSVGIDNVRYDVFLSPKFTEVAKKYLQELVRQAAKLDVTLKQTPKSSRAPSGANFRHFLSDLLQSSLARAQSDKSIEVDVLLRIGLLKYLLTEIANQFSTVILECKEMIRSRGDLFERSEQGHLLKARLAEIQGDRRNILRNVGQQVYQILAEIEDSTLARLRRTLFGQDYNDVYGILRNRLLFAENGKDDKLYMEFYALLGTFVRDQDRMETVDAMLLDFLGEYVLAGLHGEKLRDTYKSYDQLAEKAVATSAELARLEEEKESILRKMEGGTALLSMLGKKRDPGELRAALADIEKRRSHLQQKMETLGPSLEEEKRKADSLTLEYNEGMGDFLNEPENARRLFDSEWPEGTDASSRNAREYLLEEWIHRLDQRELLPHILASYELRKIHSDYCPPVHLQQLKKALVNREEFTKVEDLLKQFPARRYSLRRIEESVRNVQRCPRAEVRKAAIRFAEDFMRLRRDLRNYQKVIALMERVNLIRVERSRELSRLNNSLYECLLTDEVQAEEDRILSHVIIKTDVRGSSKMTQDLLARGLNPAAHFSLNLHEPVKGILERYGAAKVFIEGDAIILAIYEMASNRAHLRVVARACVLARQILSVSEAYNARVANLDLPPLELGVGVAYQDSSPSYWLDGESRLMISRALNLSDRLSACSKAARRLLADNPSPFNLFLFQTLAEVDHAEETEEFTIRYNMNGIELNEEGFKKMRNEISLMDLNIECPMPWGKERVTLYVGELLIGDAFERIVVRQGTIRLLQSGNKIGGPGAHQYYEVCTNPRVFELAEAAMRAERRKS